ncbi:MAG: hypothetical protein E6K19_08995, partial [Methanobacteriota archaeon]
MLHPPMVGEELSRRISPRSRVSRGPDVVLAAYASAPFPLVVPEVQVLVSVDSTHPEATPDPHGTALVLPLFRGRSPDPMNLPVGAPNQGPGLLIMIISAAPLYSEIRLVRRSAMDRLKTYVEGFDEALGGGIPRGSIVLIAGTPGTMKTGLTFSILYENAKAGSKALYISLEESQEDL